MKIFIGATNQSKAPKPEEKEIHTGDLFVSPESQEFLTFGFIHEWTGNYWNTLSIKKVVEFDEKLHSVLGNLKVDEAKRDKSSIETKTGFALYMAELYPTRPDLVNAVCR